ncbi:hypothetical protein Indivirus_2_51 [Indivirus ILV1]|uniref:C2H2-type domain-containing protein n=1 Tax=Indivirus ILV1 TaxID=1977633 RepID=A0A1V0SD86_9VIRU|nr:hypothetical protein Indivirus_2_51 [Indivirus ILV1]
MHDLYKKIYDITNIMVQYTCELCSFNSNNKTNYSRHLLTKGHLEKVGQATQNSNSIPIIIQSDSICNYCSNTYSNQSNLTKHMRKCIKKDIEEKNKNSEIERLKIENEKIKKDATEKEKIYKKQIKEIKDNFSKQLESYEKLLTSATSPQNVTNYNYILSNYPNAPALESKKSYANLLETNIMTLVDLIIMYYEQGRLVTFIGDYLVKEYLNEEPEKQSLWTTDLSRLTYIISEACKKNKNIWSYDKKGVKTKKIMIEPLLKYIRNELAKYAEDNSNSIETIMLKKLTSIIQIINEIDGNLLIDRINKYISPKFIVKQNLTDLSMIEVE